MDLTALETEVGLWLGDPNFDLFGGTAAIDAHINRAYERVVSAMDRTPHEFSVASPPTDVTTVVGTREYTLSGVRRVFDVTTVLSDGTEGYSLDIQPWTRRNRGRSVTYPSFSDRQDAIYITRTAAGSFQLGFFSIPTIIRTYHVYVSKTLTPLANGTDIPAEVPPLHHSVIAMYAAQRASATQNREIVGLEAMLSDGMRELMADLAHSIYYPTRGRRI